MIIKFNGHERLFKPKIGLALSGGGLKGAAHIGVLKTLVANNILVDMVAGTSAGAIIATMYACGYHPQQMEKVINSIDIHSLIDLKVTVTDLFKHGMKWLVNGSFRFWSVLSSGLVKGEKIEQYFVDLWQGRTVKDTGIPLAITAVDVSSGDTVFFTTPLPDCRAILNARYYYDALLSEAVRASISVPGIFLPKKYRGMTLVDGAVKNNLPTDILHHMGADIIISVDLGYSGQPNPDLKAVGEILMQCIDIMGREVTLLKGEQYADIVLRPAVGDVDSSDAKQIARCIARGEECAWANIVEISKLINTKRAI